MGVRGLDRLIAQSRKTLTVAGVNLVPILHGFQRAVGRLTPPAAVLVSIIAIEHDVVPGFVTKTVFFSTLLSLLTLTVLLTLI